MANLFGSGNPHATSLRQHRQDDAARRVAQRRAAQERDSAKETPPDKK
jgi:hypothetical protein